MSIDKKFGKDVYKWISKDPHDYLDCMSMCYAVAAANGLSSSVVT